ncbi:MAG: hypothetical protein ABH813_00370 [Patescibacteria group bacterium]
MGEQLFFELKFKTPNRTVRTFCRQNGGFLLEWDNMEKLSLPTKTKIAARFMVVVGIIGILLAIPLIWFGGGVFFIIGLFSVLLGWFFLSQRSKRAWGVVVAMLSIELVLFIWLNISNLFSAMFGYYAHILQKELIFNSYFSLEGIGNFFFPLIIILIPLILLLIDRKNFFKILSKQILTSYTGQSVIPKLAGRKKIFAIVGLILCILASLFIVIHLLLSQQTNIEKTEKLIFKETVQEEQGLEETAKDEIVGGQTYINEAYGFELKYPQDYFLEEVSKDFILIRKEDNEEFDWEIEIDTENDAEFYDEEKGEYKSTSKLAFKDFIVNEIKKSCNADGPTGSTYCTGVVKMESFKNEQGIEGYQIFITEVREAYEGWKKTGVIEKRIKGPVFAFDISQQTQNRTRGIIFQLTRDSEMSSEKETLWVVLNQMLSTFRFIH